MPSKRTSGTTGPRYPAYPNLVERLGENPARFLCSGLNPWPMVRGLRSFERASAWLAVARAEDVDGRVVEALEHKRDSLREGSE